MNIKVLMTKGVTERCATYNDVVVYKDSMVRISTWVERQSCGLKGLNPYVIEMSHDTTGISNVD